jgi:hypothetical protein
MLCNNMKASFFLCNIGEIVLYYFLCFEALHQILQHCCEGYGLGGGRIRPTGIKKLVLQYHFIFRP